MDNKHIIWSDINLDLDDWIDALRETMPYAPEDELYAEMLKTNAENLDDERYNLNIQLPQEILVIADLGLWNGRVMGYKEIKSGNIKDCLYSEADMNEWYVDKNGDLRCTAIHHDGTNHYLYRTFKSNVTDTQKENLLYKIYEGKATRQDITRLTSRLGDEIGKVYGWNFPKRTHRMEVER